MTREDWKRFQALEIDCSSIGLGQSENISYFCTPAGAEFVGWLGCDGIHFVLLPGDERVYCVDPAMGEPGTYVLPVAENFRQFLSFVLFCRDAGPIAQLWWLEEKRFREEDAQEWPGREEFLARRDGALAAIAEAFDLTPADPYDSVKALQAGFDPAGIPFSDEYYDVLDLERP